MYLRPKSENKRKCKICGEEGFVDSCRPVFECPVCHWIEDEKQEKDHDLIKGRNSKTFNEVKKEYEINWNKYGVLIDKEIKVMMKDGGVKDGVCRDYRCDALLIPDNGGWVDIVDIKDIEVIEEVIHFKCPILKGLEDDEIAEDSCRAVKHTVDNPGKDIETEKWIKEYNSNYAEICDKCDKHFPRIIMR